MKQIRIATRKSPLALWQTEHVAVLLRAAHPGIEVSLVPMSTRGDDVLDRSLAAIGGKGLFLKELELAMLRGEADCAVHSLKDVPMELDAPFALPAILERADPADAFISNLHASLDALPQGARVGTSSLRRQAQLRARRPDLQLLDLRGNVNTRLAKLDAGDYDAIVLACAGLQRLGFHDRIGDAPMQAMLSVLDHAPTRTCVEAERAMNRALHGSCHVPVAAYAQLRGDRLQLSGLVGSASDGRMVRAQNEAASDAPEALGQAVARKLLAQGAGEFL